MSIWMTSFSFWFCSIWFCGIWIDILLHVSTLDNSVYRFSFAYLPTCIACPIALRPIRLISHHYGYLQPKFEGVLDYSDVHHYIYLQARLQFELTSRQNLALAPGHVSLILRPAITNSQLLSMQLYENTRQQSQVLWGAKDRKVWDNRTSWGRTGASTRHWKWKYNWSDRTSNGYFAIYQGQACYSSPWNKCVKTVPSEFIVSGKLNPLPGLHIHSMTSEKVCDQ